MLRKQGSAHAAERAETRKMLLYHFAKLMMRRHVKCIEDGSPNVAIHEKIDEQRGSTAWPEGVPDTGDGLWRDEYMPEPGREAHDPFGPEAEPAASSAGPDPPAPKPAQAKPIPVPKVPARMSRERLNVS